jgi:hypothetical protein
VNAYEEACADPRMVRIDPDIVIRPFHQPFAGMEQEWHVYCAVHPEFGFCGVEGAARREALEHGNAHAEGAPDE